MTIVVDEGDTPYAPHDSNARDAFAESECVDFSDDWEKTCGHRHARAPDLHRHNSLLPNYVLSASPAWLWATLLRLADDSKRSRFRQHGDTLASLTSKRVVSGFGSGLFGGRELHDDLGLSQKNASALYDDVNRVINLPRECAGYLLANYTSKCIDEMCVVNVGPTFEETDRLGVVPVDLNGKRRHFSQKSGVTKKQVVSFHSHPLVIREYLGEHAPPSFEDGACFLSTLLRSDVHAVFGYSGVYLLRKLRGNNWNAARVRSACEAYVSGLFLRQRLLGSRSEIVGLHENLAIQSIMESHHTLGTHVNTEELRRMRTMRFDTLEDIRNYLLTFMHLFRLKVVVEFYPYTFSMSREAGSL
ncbi:hypothetical protein CYMTET_47707 [Cymbomonas tetramitiformis]|uniref:Uncharacterized protein n=1 Tax=Cymbomonas tetramitiformis TaxID=36881 RepID=A0AAE0BTJ0_9CHLO|nr:hypothetical protein CYMTET_47707 [Cymbomonas tetramitiformis]